MDTLLSVGTVIAITLSGLSLWQLRQLRARFTEALSNSNGESIEETLAGHHRRVAEVDSRLTQLSQSHERLAVASGLASQKISVVRFNPFGDTGGDQSFVLAVLDTHNSGYVLTSIHGREGTRVYVKPIDYGKSKYTLSREEQQALDQAARRVPQE